MNTLAFCKQHETAHPTLDLKSKMLSLRQALFKLGVRWVDSNQGNDFGCFKVCLYTSSDVHKNRKGLPIRNECNGLILQYDSSCVDTSKWRVLCHPTKSIYSGKIDEIELDTALANQEYFLYPALDATIINLYYDGTKWCMGTHKGYDVSNMHFSNDLSYREALDEIVARKNYYDFSFDKLNKLHTYTIAMRIRYFHLFDEGGNKNDYLKLLAIDGCRLGISNGNIFLRNHVDTSIDINIGLEKCYGKLITNVTFQSLLGLCNKQLIEYDNASSKGTHYMPMYGIILERSNEHLQTVFIPSDLFKMIKVCLYNNPNRYPLYTVIRMAFNKRHTYRFKTLFPEYIPHLARAQALQRTIIEQVCSLCKKPDYEACALAQTVFHNIFEGTPEKNISKARAMAVLELSEPKYIEDIYKMLTA